MRRKTLIIESMSRRSLSRSPERSSILVLAIWIMVFFSILAAGVYRIIATQVSIVRAVEERVICPNLAQAACYYARLENDSDQTAYDSLGELLAERELNLGHGKAVYTQIDEESKLNLNTCSEDSLARLPEMNINLAKKVLASELFPFELIEELLLVEGITPEIYAEIKDFITVFSNNKININTASAEVLIAVGMDEGLTGLIVEYRAGPDAKDGTGDDRVFETVPEVIDELRAYGSLSGVQEALLLSLESQGLLTVESKNFELKINTQILGKNALKYDIILDKDWIKQWREF